MSDQPSVFANVGVHAGVDIEPHLAKHDGESAWIAFGDNEQLIIDFADPESMDRLAGAAALGARLFRERIAANRAARVTMQASGSRVRAGVA